MKGIVKWRKGYVKPLAESMGIEFELISNGNEDSGVNENPVRDSSPSDPYYVSTEEGLEIMGLARAWGNRSSEVQRALINSGFEIELVRGGHYKIYYNGEVVKSPNNRPVMLTTSNSLEVTPGCMANIAKNCCRFKRIKDFEAA